jgi:DUF2905 family protein
MITYNGLVKLLILQGDILIVAGTLIFLVDKLPWVGRLSSDKQIQRLNCTIFLPVTPSILMRAILSLGLYIVSRRQVCCRFVLMSPNTAATSRYRSIQGWLRSIRSPTTIRLPCG